MLPFCETKKSYYLFFNFMQEKNNYTDHLTIGLIEHTINVQLDKNSLNITLRNQ